MVKNSLEDKLHTLLLSVVTAGVIGCCAFLWNLNGTVARLQERDTENIKAREEWSNKTNAMQLDLRDIRERVIRIEAKNHRQ